MGITDIRREIASDVKEMRYGTTVTRLDPRAVMLAIQSKEIPLDR